MSTGHLGPAGLTRAEAAALLVDLAESGEHTGLALNVAGRPMIMRVGPVDHASNELLTVRRTRPGQDPYWVLPGSGVKSAPSVPT